MTLISVTSNFGFPILLGDILTTSETPDQEQHIPTFLSSVTQWLPTDQKLRPYRLRRKVYVIDDQLAIGLAGSGHEMKEFLGEIKNYFKYHAVSEANILTFLQEFGQQTYPNSSAILVHAANTPEGILITYHYFGAWQKRATPRYGDVFACGSGSNDFLEAVSQEWSLATDSATNDLRQAIALNYCLLGNVLNQERLELSTIKKQWGAGFEMIYFDGKRFRHMDDITIVLWKGQLTIATGEVNVSPLTFINYRYSSDGEILIINVCNGSQAAAYGALPLYLKSEDIDQSTMPTKLHFDSRHICFSYVLQITEPIVIGSETDIRTVTPTMYVEKTPDIETVFMHVEDDELFVSANSDGSIPNMGIAKVGFSRDGRLQIAVQQGLHEAVVAGVIASLRPQLGYDGQIYQNADGGW